MLKKKTQSKRQSDNSILEGRGLEPYIGKKKLRTQKLRFKKKKKQVEKLKIVELSKQQIVPGIISKRGGQFKWCLGECFSEKKNGDFCYQL